MPILQERPQAQERGLTPGLGVGLGVGEGWGEGEEEEPKCEEAPQNMVRAGHKGLGPSLKRQPQGNMGPAEHKTN